MGMQAMQDKRTAKRSMPSDTVCLSEILERLPAFRPLNAAGFPKFPRACRRGLYERHEVDAFLSEFNRMAALLDTDQRILPTGAMMRAAAACHVGVSAEDLEKDVPHDGVILRFGTTMPAWLKQTLDAYLHRRQRAAQA